MINLLNRIAWVVSLCAGFVMTMLWWIIVDVLDWSSKWFDNGTTMVWIVLIIIFWSLFKKMFLSKEWIEKQIEVSIVDSNNKSLEQNKQEDSILIENVYEQWIGIEKKQIETKNIEKIQNLSEYENSLKQDLQNEEKEILHLQEQTQEKKESSKFILTIKWFFTENVMAKIWWILIFLSVLFFLHLIYSQIWNVWRLIIWFVVWFTTIWVGVFLDKKKFENESRILLWLWFLINYLVILAWRYLLWTNADPFLSEWLTFILLILNTIFAITTSLVYKSNNLLIFAFIFAYINPFLIWWESTTPYTLSIYSMIVSLWAIFLSLKFKEKYISKVLILWSFTLWNLLILLAPFTTIFDWWFKLAFMLILWIITFYFSYKRNCKFELSILSILSYIFMMLLILYGSLKISSIFTWMFDLTLLIIWILFLFTITVISVFQTAISNLALFLLFPFILITILLYLFEIKSVITILPILLLMFVYVFAIVWWKISWFIKYVLWIFLWVILSFFSVNISLDLDYTKWLIIALTSLIMLVATYYFSTKKHQEYLYTIWSLFSAILLSFVIHVTHVKLDLLTLSIISIVIYFALNVWLLFFSENLLKSNISNVSFWIIIWLIFTSLNLYRFWQAYFPWIALWFGFLLLAILYFIISFVLYKKLKPKLSSDKTKNQAQDVIYSVLAWSISLLSLAISYIFSKHWEIVATSWILEWVILLYFFSRQKNSKIYIWAMILFIIWLIKLSCSVSMISRWDYIALIPLWIISAIWLIWVKFMQNSRKWEEIFFNIFHIIWICILWDTIWRIFTYNNYWFGFLSVSILTSFLLIYYSKLKLKYLFEMFLILFVLICILHISIIWKIFNILFYYNVEFLKIFQYIATWILWTWFYFAWKNKKTCTLVYISFVLYLLYITSYYVYDIFVSTFTITIYWWILAWVLLTKWINQDIVKYRTIGLYLLILSVWKIIFFDIWYSLDTAIVRVFALMIVWILMIYISTLYTKKYNWNLKWELSWKNIK